MSAMFSPGASLGRYRLDHVLGRGGMGTVCLAYDTELHRPVAIKIIDGDGASRTRVLQEARSAAALNHPNICTIFEVGEAAGSLFIAMEYLDGHSLRDRIDGRSLSIEEALRYGLQTAEALAYAHEHRVIHRDIKAANAIVSDAGWLKIIDFGLARRDVALGPQATTMQSVIPRGVAAGTPYTMAPEQVQGASTSPASDVWALGVLLCEMATGGKPFDGTTTGEIFAAILRDEPCALPWAVPSELQGLIRRCLETAPDARPQAAEVRDALKGIVLGQRSATSHPAARPSLSRAASPQRRVLVLPFANVSSDPDTDYFADGLTEELIADLSRVQSLLVISRASAMKLKARTEDIRTIAEKVGADLVLDGSVRKGKSSLRIAVQLVDAAVDCPIWAEKFAAADEDLFELQERLSRQIIEAMQITLSKAENELVSLRPITDLRVYDIYLRAQQRLRRFSARDLDEAVELLRTGLKALKGNELLLATLGQAYVYYVHWGVRPDRRYLDDAQRCADEILTQRPESSDGHALCGALEMKRANLQGAVRHLKKAVQADPTNVEAATWLVYCYLTAGQTQSALPLIERLLTADPLTGLHHAGYGWFHVDDGRAEEALRHYRRALDLDPSAPALSFLWGWALVQAERGAEALSHFERISAELRSSVLGDLAAGFHHALAGNASAARGAIGEHAALAGGYDEAIAHFLSQLYGLLDDSAEASTWLEHALKAGYLDYPEIMRDPCYRAIRSEPNFASVVAALRRRWEAFEP
jgi:serine/threonine-protein kinase